VSDWLLRARAAANLGPAGPRAPLWLAAADALHEVGSIEPALAARAVAASLPLIPCGSGCRVEVPWDESLLAIARWLDGDRPVSRWRGELLAVVDAAGRSLASVERSAVRVLGMTTFAVHLVGCATDGRHWVQQRAFDKATDPGAWDTLMGGQVTAGESIATTLARETMEEAGLAIADLPGIERCPDLLVRRPVDDGYMVEHIAVFRAVLPKGRAPENRDGEVERFECLAENALRERLGEGAFTLEATLILGAELGRQDEASRS
jgi:8-oxo-dGTP pyrophosphatase MutT (NUDIX family)